METIKEKLERLACQRMMMARQRMEEANCRKGKEPEKVREEWHLEFSLVHDEFNFWSEEYFKQTGIVAVASNHGIIYDFRNPYSHQELKKLDSPQGTWGYFILNVSLPTGDWHWC